MPQTSPMKWSIISWSMFALTSSMKSTQILKEEKTKSQNKSKIKTMKWNW